MTYTDVLEFMFWTVGNSPDKDNSKDVRSTPVVKYPTEGNNISIEDLLVPIPRRHFLVQSQQ